METETITNAEWEIMRVVWTQGTTTSSEVVALLEDKLAWKASTVKTLLNRLVEKKFLATEKSGNKFIYRALVSESDSTSALSHEVAEKICARKIPELINELIAENALTSTDIETLIAELQEKRKTAVESIACNCVPADCHCHDHHHDC